MSLSEIDELIKKNPLAATKQLLLSCHPDKHPDGDKALANQLFIKIEKLLEEQKYEHFVGKYKLGPLWRSGDVSDIYLSSDGLYYIKVGDAALLKIEYDNLLKILKGSEGTAFIKQFPRVVEHFKVKGKAVNVFCRETDFNHISLEDVRKEKPDGLSGRHIAWIFKRLLAALDATHRAGIVHGAILPQHFLIDKIQHVGLLVGFGQSTTVGGIITNGVSGFRAWYPPEVLNKHSVGPPTDIYMAAQLILWLADKTDIDRKIRSFLSGCMLEKASMRPASVWELHEEFSQLLFNLYGKPTYAKWEEGN